MELKFPRINTVLVTGHLADAPIRITGKSTPGVYFRLAIATYARGAGHSRVFIGCVTWGPTAEACIEKLEKGSPVIVSGALQVGKSGDTQIKADRVQFLARMPQEAISADPALSPGEDTETPATPNDSEGLGL